MKKFECKKCGIIDDDEFRSFHLKLCNKCLKNHYLNSKTNKIEQEIIQEPNNFKEITTLTKKEISLNKRKVKMEIKYNVKILSISPENDYIKIEDKNGYQYELTYLGISKFKFSVRNMTNESYLKYYNEKFISDKKYTAISLEGDRIKIYNNKTSECAIQPKYKFNLDAVESITEKSYNNIKFIKNKFGNKYDYSELEYNGIKSDATLICPDHGRFSVTWSNLMRPTHQGCKICTYTQKRFGKVGFIERCERLRTDGFLYVVKMFNNEDYFYKIGITSNIDIRLSKFPYKSEIIYLFKGDPGDVYDLEKFLHKKYSSELYIPDTKFNGYMECFKFNNTDKILLEISEYSNKLLKLLIV